MKHEGMTEIASREIDEHYMKKALSLAILGQGETAPNPMVGCVRLLQSIEGRPGNIK